jgi:GNAT superfamily N-acetyltransferase
VGIFAQRGKNRPNRLGLTTVRVLGVEGRVLRVAELDAIDGTPVLDIKPVMAEFLPRTPLRQHAWFHELTRNYWRSPSHTTRLMAAAEEWARAWGYGHIALDTFAVNGRARRFYRVTAIRRRFRSW